MEIFLFNLLVTTECLKKIIYYYQVRKGEMAKKCRQMKSKLFVCLQ